MPLNKTSTQLLDKQEPLELVLALDSFAGGENTIGEDQELKSNEARVIENWDSISLGGMVRSNGFVKQTDVSNLGIDANCKLMLHMDGTDESTTFTDSEITPKTVTANGAADIDTTKSKFGGASGEFNGSNAYLSASSADFEWGTNVTLDFWIYVTALANGVIWSQGTNIGQINYIALLNTGAIECVFANAGAEVDFSSPASVIPTSTWTHVAIVKNGTTWYIFINGVSQTLTLNTGSYSTTITTKGNTLIIGRRLGANDLYYGGSLDEMRFSNSARWTVNFTPPTSQYNLSTGQYDLILHHYEGSSVRNYVLNNGDLGYINGSVITKTDAAAFTPGILSHGVTAGNKAWITNSTDNLKFTTIGGTIAAPSTLPGAARSRIYYHKQRLIAEGNGVTIYGSRAGSGNWAGAGGWTTSGDAWNIDMPDLTQGCVPGFPSPDQIAVFTLEGTFYLYNFPNIAYQPVNINRGCSAPYSIAYGKEGVFFLSQYPTLGIFLWDSINFTNLTLYENFVNDINFSNRIFGIYRGNSYYIFYSSTANGKSYPDTLRIYDTRFGRWMTRPINPLVNDTFGYPCIFIKPTNDLWVGSSQKAITYQLENGTSDATYSTNANFRTKDFSSKDFTIDGQSQVPLDEIRMKLLKVSMTFYGSVGNFTLQWTSDRGIRSGSQIFDLTGVGDLINTTFIVNTSSLASPPPTKTVTRSFDNSAIGRRFNFQLLQNGTGDLPKIKKIKLFALALEEA